MALATTSGASCEAADSAPLWLPLHSVAARFGHLHFRSVAAKPPEERSTPREFRFISVFFFLALPFINLTSAAESQFFAFWADKSSRFNQTLLEVVNSDEWRLYFS